MDLSAVFRFICSYLIMVGVCFLGTWNWWTGPHRNFKFTDLRGECSLLRKKFVVVVMVVSVAWKLFTAFMESQITTHVLTLHCAVKQLSSGKINFLKVVRRLWLFSKLPFEATSFKFLCSKWFPWVQFCFLVVLATLLITELCVLKEF